jgi:Tfp pilus assembly protein PilF
VLYFLRWPETAHPTVIAFMGLGVMPLMLSFGIALRVLLRVDASAMNVLGAIVATPAFVVISNPSRLLMQTLPCFYLAWQVWRSWRRTRRWHCQAGRWRTTIAIGMTLASILYVSLVFAAGYTAWKDGDSEASLYSDTATKAFQDKNYDMAIRLSSRAIRIDPSDIDARYNRALAYYSRGLSETGVRTDFERARVDLNFVIKRNPEDGNAYVLMGQCWSESGQPEEALAAFHQAIQINSKNREARFERGLILYEKKDFARALADFNVVITIDSQDGAALYNRGLCHKQLGNAEEAAQDLARAKELGMD